MLQRNIFQKSEENFVVKTSETLTDWVSKPIRINLFLFLYILVALIFNRDENHFNLEHLRILTCKGFFFKEKWNSTFLGERSFLYALEFIKEFYKSQTILKISSPFPISFRKWKLSEFEIFLNLFLLKVARKWFWGWSHKGKKPI